MPGIAASDRLAPALRRRLERGDPDVRIMVDGIAVVRGDVKRRYDQFGAADALAGLELRQPPRYGVALAGTNGTQLAFAPAGTGYITDLDAASPLFCCQAKLAGTQDPNTQLKQIIPKLHPANGGPQNVATWRCSLWYASEKNTSAPLSTTRPLALTPLGSPVDATAGPSEGNVPFDFQPQDLRPFALPRPAGANSETAPLLYVLIQALKSDGSPATNVGWKIDNSGTYTQNGITISTKRLATGGRADEGYFTETTSTGPPSITIDCLGSMVAADVSFTGAGNQIDLGGVPSSAGAVVFTVEGERPAGTSITAYARVNGVDPWIQVADGQTAADVGLAASQTYQMKAHLAPSGTQATPLLTDLGARELARTGLSNLVIARISSGWGFDPITLKGRIAEAVFVVLQDGERDFRDAITTLMSGTNSGDLWFRVSVGADDLDRADWYHVDDFYPEDQRGLGGAIEIRCVNALALLRGKLPRYDAGNRTALVYSNVTLKYAFDDLLRVQLAVPDHLVGAEVEAAGTTDILTKTIAELTDGKAEVDAVSMRAGGAVTAQQGRITFVDVHGQKSIRAAFPLEEITQETVTPGWSQAAPTFYADYGWDESKQAYQAQHRGVNALAVTTMGVRALDRVEFLPDVVAKGIPIGPGGDEARYVTPVVTRQIETFGTGMITIGFRSTRPKPSIWPGDLVAVRVDRLAAKSPTDGRAIKGYTWVLGVVSRRNDFLGTSWEVLVRRYSDILASTAAVTLDPSVTLPSFTGASYGVEAGAGAVAAYTYRNLAQALPSGLWRTALYDNDTWKLQRNLAVAGDFSSLEDVLTIPQTGGASFSRALQISGLVAALAGLTVSGGAASLDRTVSGQAVLTGKVTGDAQVRFNVSTGGTLSWGDGTAALDTNLYRTAADNLKTDDLFTTAGGLAVTGGSIAASGIAATVGALTGTAGATFAGNVLLDNAFSYNIKDSGGTARRGLYIDAANLMYIGPGAGVTEIRLFPGTSAYMSVGGSGGTAPVSMGALTATTTQLGRTGIGAASPGTFTQLAIAGAITASGQEAELLRLNGTGAAHASLSASANGDALQVVRLYAPFVDINKGAFTGLTVSGVELRGDFAVTGAGTIDNAATLRIVNAPTIGTNNHAIWVQAGTTTLQALTATTITASANVTSTAGSFVSYNGAVGGAQTTGVQWSKSGAPAIGNPYWAFHTTADAVPVAFLQSWDGTNARRYMEFYHDAGVGHLRLAPSGGTTVNVLVGTTSPATGNPRLDVVGSGAGSNASPHLVGASLTTDTTPKRFDIGVRHYTNAEETVVLIRGATDVSATTIQYGGMTAATPAMNAVTAHEWYTAADTVTLGGTLAMDLTGVGTASLLYARGDVQIGTLGRFDGTDTPLDLQLLVYNATAARWRAESFQLLYSAGDTKAQVQSDGTTVAYLQNDPGTGADSPVGAPPTPTGTPVLTQTHKAMTVDISAIVAAYSPPADFRYWEVRVSTDNFVTNNDLLCYMTGSKAVHGRLDTATPKTYYYRVRAVDRAGNLSGFSSTASAVAVANNQVSAFGALIASEISVTSLAAINANIGIATAGQLRNNGNTAGVNLYGAGGIPGGWTTGINFESGATVSGMTFYHNFAATGTSDWLHSPRFRVQADGATRIYNSGGTVLLEAAGTSVRMFDTSSNVMFFLDGTDYYLQQAGASPTAGVLIRGTLPGTWTRYVNLNGSGYFIESPVFRVGYDGSMILSRDIATTTWNINVSSTQFYLAGNNNTQGVVLEGSVPGGWTRYLNLNGSGTMLHHDKLDLNYDGTAIFRGVAQETDSSPHFKIDFPNKLLTIYDEQATPVKRLEFGKFGTGANYGITAYDSSGGIAFQVRNTISGMHSVNSYFGADPTGASPTYWRAFFSNLDWYDAGTLRFSITPRATTGGATFSATTGTDPALIFAQQVRLADGSVSAPAVSFTNETSSGWYRAGAGDLRFARSGADVIQVTLGAAEKVIIFSSGVARMTIEGGMQLGAPTGGDKGAGTLNVSSNIYKQGTAYTNPDYVLEHWATGAIARFADRDGARFYDGLWPLARVLAFAREHYTLPRIHQARERAGGTLGLFDGGEAIQASLEESYLYLGELEARITALESAVARGAATS